MATAYWFCPENDIALGRDTASFTPPRQAAMLGRYGALLPWWSGTPDDVVLVPSDLSELERYALEQWQTAVTQAFGEGPRFVTNLNGIDRITRLQPWGISRYSAHRLERAGAPAHLTDAMNAKADECRRLSHRRSSIRICRLLTEAIKPDKLTISVPHAPVEAFSIDEASKTIAEFGEVYVKSPWSSSGRGVLHGHADAPGQLLRRCENAIATQGSVMIERAHKNLLDFAMLFRASEGKVTPEGLSLFFNVRDGAYGGNMLASDAGIAAHIRRLLPDFEPELLGGLMCRVLETLIGDSYTGPLGIDMMVAEENGNTYLVPCVELNLRATMGFVARDVYRKTAGRYNLMQIIPGGVLNGATHNALKGELADLVPPNPYFRIIARHSDMPGL